jgi:DNA-binding transcriptional ArsR family regulator
MKTALKQPYRQFFGTLANQIRLEILSILIQGESNVSNIVSKLDYDQTSISHSLSRLTECGFVTVRKNGKERLYSLNKTTIEPLFKLMNVHVNNYCMHVVEEKMKKKEMKK